jgi:transcriptional regulator with XRE-family HTH domain
MSKLRDFRTAKGLSRAELARRAAVTRGYVHHLETGVRRAPGLRTLNALAAALGLDPAEHAQLVLSFETAPSAVVSPPTGLPTHLLQAEPATGEAA